MALYVNIMAQHEYINGSICKYNGSIYVCIMAQYNGRICKYTSSTAIYNGAIGIYNGSICKYNCSIGIYNGSVSFASSVDEYVVITSYITITYQS